MFDVGSESFYIFVFYFDASAVFFYSYDLSLSLSLVFCILRATFYRSTSSPEDLFGVVKVALLLAE